MAGHCVTVLMAHQISQDGFYKAGAGTIFIIGLWVNIFRKDYQILKDLQLVFWKHGDGILVHYMVHLGGEKENLVGIKEINHLI